MILRFSKPYETSSPGRDGLVYEFPFRIIESSRGARKDSVSEYAAKADISRTLLSVWGFDQWRGGNEIIASTLFEYVKEDIFDRLISEESLEDIEIYLGDGTEENEYPFQKDKLTDPANAEFKFDVERLRQKYRENDENNQTMGFQVPDAGDGT